MEKQTGEAANGSYGGVKKRYDYDDDKRNKDESKKKQPGEVLHSPGCSILIYYVNVS